MQPKVSVLIPAYRAIPYIRRSVQSALGQTWEDLEVVVASDDGADYALALREQGVDDPRVRCVSTGGVGTGAASARNAALAAARGQVMVTLDADDWIDRRALEILVPLAIEHGAAYSRPRFIDEATGAELESLDRPLPTGPVTLEDILSSQIHTYAGIAFDRRRVKATWPAWMARWEDVFFYVRCFDDIEHMAHVAEPLYAYHRVEGSICNRAETGAEYLYWTRELLARIHRGDALGLASPAALEVFRRFLVSREIIEEAFIRATAEGRCRDFHSFTRENLPLFYQLPATARLET